MANLNNQARVVSLSPRSPLLVWYWKFFNFVWYFQIFFCYCGVQHPQAPKFHPFLLFLSFLSFPTTITVTWLLCNHAISTLHIPALYTCLLQFHFTFLKVFLFIFALHCFILVTRYAAGIYLLVFVQWGTVQMAVIWWREHCSVCYWRNFDHASSRFNLQLGVR